MLFFKVANTQDENTADDNETETTQEDNTENETTQNTNTLNRAGARSLQKKRRQNFDIDDAQRQLNTSFQTLNNILNKKTTEEDDCDLYGKLLITKLRKYPERMRQKLMYKIDGLLLENPPPSADFKRHNWTPSSAHTISSSPSYIIPQSPGHFIPQSPGHAIPQSPSYIIPQSPGHSISQSPVTIIVPEDYDNIEDSLMTQTYLIESEPQNKINIISQETIKPHNTNKNLIKTAFFKAQQS